jgi:hypothetical protein
VCEATEHTGYVWLKGCYYVCCGTARLLATTQQFSAVVVLGKHVVHTFYPMEPSPACV